MGPSVPPISPVPNRARMCLAMAVLLAGASVLAGCRSAGADDEAGAGLDAGPATIEAVAATPGTTAPGTSTDRSLQASTTAPAVTSTPAQVTGTDPPTSTIPPDTAGGVTTSTPVPVAAGGARPAPDWLGQRPLPTTPAGAVVANQTTPDELVDRRFVTVDRLAPPPDGAFASTIGPVEADVLARSTWVEGCPVGVEDLAYVTVSFWGFDDRPHTGELIVHRAAATDLVGVFQRLWEIRYPIEEMRVTSRADLDAAPTGDGNNTTAFVCRPVTGGSSFSEHASGLAIDINPFLNPYQRGDLVLPELATAHLERSPARAGMITDGDAVVEAFAAMGWAWGGDWRSLKDYQHFSHNGR